MSLFLAIETFIRNDHAGYQNPDTKHGFVELLGACVMMGNKIPAIKLVRHSFDELELREVKNIVENLQALSRQFLEQDGLFLKINRDKLEMLLLRNIIATLTARIKNEKAAAVAQMRERLYAA